MEEVTLRLRGLVVFVDLRNQGAVLISTRLGAGQGQPVRLSLDELEAVLKEAIARKQKGGE